MKKFLEEFEKEAGKTAGKIITPLILGLIGGGAMLVWQRVQHLSATSTQKLLAILGAAFGTTLIAFSGLFLVRRLLGRNAGKPKGLWVGSFYPGNNNEAMAILAIISNGLGASEQDIQSKFSISRNDLLYHLGELECKFYIIRTMRGNLGEASGWYEITHAGRGLIAKLRNRFD